MVVERPDVNSTARRQPRRGAVQLERPAAARPLDRARTISI